MDVFQIKDLTFTYPTGEKPVLREVSLDIARGEFVTLCGKTGSGKTTLLRHLKPAITPHGRCAGEVLFSGRPVRELDPRRQAAEIGFVFQSPDNQIVTDKVWHELAFGLESLGYDTRTIRIRVAETAYYFGIGEWFRKPVDKLSGGQKQLLNLAGIMAMQPSVLVLDEPTSQLDPIAALEFIHTIHRINRELGVTVIISEHRLEELLHLSDRLVVMDNGEILAQGKPSDVCVDLIGRGHDMLMSMPTPVRVYAESRAPGECPLTVGQGRKWLSTLIKTPEAVSADTDLKEKTVDGKPALELDNVWFRYEKSSADVLRGFSISVMPGEIVSVAGGNGAGKTTALSVMSGALKPYRGKVKLFGKPASKGGNIGMLPQDAKTVFLTDSVKKDLEEAAGNINRVYEIAKLLGITHLLESHPYDLSGGEQQKAALAKLLLRDPGILLLDEPTKGFDGFFKKEFSKILKSLADSGKAIVIVSHDLEFCAGVSDRCAMLFDGINITENIPKYFFGGNSFYTTAASRMSRGIISAAVTPGDIVNALKEEGI